MKFIDRLKFLAFILFLHLLSVGCIKDSGVSKNRGKVTDYSIASPTTLGCGATQYATISATTYSCTSTCATGYHIANATELASAKASATGNTLIVLNSSLGLCISDINAVRPTGEIYPVNGFCSCLAGKSDIINDCDAFCSSKSKTTLPTLFLSVILGADISGNKYLGNLDNWCNFQLQSDSTKPQCFLSAWDGTNTIDNIPVTVASQGNSLTADLSTLSYNTTYTVKIYEGKTGSNASSNYFQIRRTPPPSTTTPAGGALKITPISQYTCIEYGVDPNNVNVRTSYARHYYYFPANQTPPAIPQMGGTNLPTIVCHDEVAFGINDNALYPRLELIPAQTTMWDMTDSRFVKDPNTGILAIDSIIQSRLLNEYNVNVLKMDLFSLMSIPSWPNVSASSSSTSSSSTPVSNTAQGFYMSPFINATTNQAYCPTQNEYNGTDSIFKILKDYMGDTEGLYLGEKEPETVQIGANSYKTVYGTMFATETLLVKYGFYIENGLKIKATAPTLHNKTIYYYWPVNTLMDPLEQGDRKLFTIRYNDQLNGNTPSGVFTNVRPDDKRIGCVPKTTN